MRRAERGRGRARGRERSYLCEDHEEVGHVLVVHERADDQRRGRARVRDELRHLPHPVHRPAVVPLQVLEDRAEAQRRDEQRHVREDTEDACGLDVEAEVVVEEGRHLREQREADEALREQRGNEGERGGGRRRGIGSHRSSR